MKQLFPLLLAPLLLNAQIEYSGSIHPSNLYRISDGSEISLPFRLVDMELGYTWRDFDLKTNSAIEYRWSTGEYELDLREAYLAWYPSFGEVKVGKQIFAWGAADGNNPTDNLSAYDYYYLFFPGVDRKIGSLSVVVNLYFGNWQIEAVLIPEHQRNRLPFGEPDFPIAPPVQPTKEQIVAVEKPLEFGVRLQTSIVEGDISLSYFRGHDRNFSLLGLDGPSWACILTIPRFGFRQTDVVGADIVTFISDLTIRGEGAYFKTTNNYENVLPILESSAEYFQYVLQAEYTGFFDVSLVGQFIGNSILSVEGETLDQTTQQVIPITKETFQPGMGTPFAMFVDQALMLTATGNLMDDRLKLSAFSFISLEETGYMLGLGVEYSPIENWNIEISLNKFIGDGNPGSDNFFNRLEDFSHVFIGLKYSF